MISAITNATAASAQATQAAAPTAPVADPRIQKAARDFEAIFVRQIGGTIAVSSTKKPMNRRIAAIAKP